MRRTTNRAFRYTFPLAMAGLCLYFLKDAATSEANAHASKSDVLEDNQILPAGIDSSSKTQAKILKLSSHNPEKQTRLFINATEASQDSDKILLKEPRGNFEKPGGNSSLQSSQASYYEHNDEVHFLDDVNFDHHSGLVATTEQAILNTKTHNISGSEGIKATHKQNRIASTSYEFQPQKNVLSFKDGVSLTVSQKDSVD